MESVNKKQRRLPDLGNDSVRALVVKLALPAIAAQLINLLYNLVDRIYVGALPGEEGTDALAALAAKGRKMAVVSNKGDAAVQQFIYAFYPFLFGVYPYTNASEKQQAAMREADVVYRESTIAEIAAPLVRALTQTFSS